jgi:hypothetical protein
MADAVLDAGGSVAFASRPTPRLDQAVAQRRARGLAAVAVPMDVRDPLAVQVGTEQAVGLLGGIDLAMNNAGIGMRTVNPRFLDQPIAFFEVSPEGFSDVAKQPSTAQRASLLFLERHSVVTQTFLGPGPPFAGLPSGPVPGPRPVGQRGRGLLLPVRGQGAPARGR